MQHIFVVQLGMSKTLKLAQPTTIILAAIRACSDPQLKDNRTYYYTQEGHMDVVDMGCVQCLIGRVADRGKWAIIDCSRDATRPVFILDE